MVFTIGLSYSVRRGIAEIDRAIPNLRWLVVIEKRTKSVQTVARSQWRNLKRNGWRWIPYQLADIRRRFEGEGAGGPAPSAPGRCYDSAALEAQGNLTTLVVSDIHQESTLEAVRRFAPELGLSLAAPILKRELFAIPAQGTINLHKGKVPDYRGMPPAFWELWNDEAAVGCTVHWVDDKLDTGAIAAEATVAREAHSTLRGLQLCLDQVGVELMRDVVVAVLSGQRPARPQPPGGKTYRKPTLAQFAELERKMRGVQAQGVGPAKQHLKNTVASAAFELWDLGGKAVLPPRLTVLLYHRVTDQVRDNLTVGVEQFDRQLALLRRRCRLVSIEEILGWEKVPRSPQPFVCVTFDDGYLDNYQHAVPILLRHQVPAAFFVSTGIVGTGNPFPHDVLRGNPPIPNMGWDQLREMRASGFTIGSHSVSHLDCASEPEEKVWSELVQSRDDLARELSVPPQELIFAYPYGKRHNMTAERLELVKRAGFRGCLSAYGGSNFGSIDRFNVLRRGIHWEFSDQALLLECLGIR
ncbi:MAG: polysaccharide deacetylase family protein [Deltaproteobacteria bacterium]|nr:polysaccharide deacetylase family protein [Deltaproteobacteria bacterium]